MQRRFTEGEQARRFAEGVERSSVRGASLAWVENVGGGEFAPSGWWLVTWEPAQVELPGVGESEEVTNGHA